MAPTPPRERRQATRPARPYHLQNTSVSRCPFPSASDAFRRGEGDGPSSQTLARQVCADRGIKYPEKRTRKAATAAPAPIAKTEAIVVSERRSVAELVVCVKVVETASRGLGCCARASGLNWGAFFAPSRGMSAVRRNRSPIRGGLEQCADGGLYRTAKKGRNYIKTK